MGEKHFIYSIHFWRFHHLLSTFTQLWRLVSSCEAVPFATKRYIFLLPDVNIVDGTNPFHCSLYPLTFLLFTLSAPFAWTVLVSGVWCFICFVFLCIKIPVGIYSEVVEWLREWELCSQMDMNVRVLIVLAWKLQALLLLSSVLLASSAALLSSYPQLRESSLFPASVLWWETPAN